MQVILKKGATMALGGLMLKKLDGGLYEITGSIALGERKGHVKIDAVGYDLKSLLNSGVYYILVKGVPPAPHKISTNRFLVKYLTERYQLEIK